MIITLEWYEVEMAAILGVRRWIEAHRRGLSDRIDGKGTQFDSITNNVKGTLGEAAAAKALRSYWIPGNCVDGAEPDVVTRTGGLQIRFSGDPDGKLKVRDSDHDDAQFVLVVPVKGDNPFAFRVVGWLPGKDAKRPEYKSDPGKRNRPAFFVPQSHLNPIPDGYKNGSGE